MEFFFEFNHFAPRESKLKKTCPPSLLAPKKFRQNFSFFVPLFRFHMCEVSAQETKTAGRNGHFRAADHGDWHDANIREKCNMWSLRNKGRWSFWWCWRSQMSPFWRLGTRNLLKLDSTVSKSSYGRFLPVKSHENIEQSHGTPRNSLKDIGVSIF